MMSSSTRSRLLIVAAVGVMIEGTLGNFIPPLIQGKLFKSSQHQRQDRRGEQEQWRTYIHIDRVQHCAWLDVQFGLCPHVGVFPLPLFETEWCMVGAQEDKLKDTRHRNICLHTLYQHTSSEINAPTLWYHTSPAPEHRSVQQELPSSPRNWM